MAHSWKSKGQDAKPTKVARFFAGTVALRATKPAKLVEPKPKPAGLIGKKIGTQNMAGYTVDDSEFGHA
jgi:hypothetical protein